MSDWYQQDVSQVLTAQAVTVENGLDEAEAAQRLAQIGLNELVDKGGKNPWAILWEQLTGVMTIVLIISAVVSLFLQDNEDAIAILAIVVLNTILGFTQEYRAEKAMAALKKISVPRVKVRRSGHISEISATELVPGDVVLLESGNLIPADGRLVEAINLKIQEAILTGESEAVEKITAALPQPNLGLGDQRNRAYMGTVVTYGRGTLLVTETGMKTQLGRIAEMLQSVKSEATPLQRRLAQLAKGLAAAALVIVVIVFVLGVLRGEEVRLMFMTAISMAVAAIPEGLPTVVTIGLALGAQRMLGRKALIRKLPAVETLGSVTVICSDKTGTLTENRMTVTYLDVANHQLDLTEELRDYSPTANRGEVIQKTVDHPAIQMMLKAAALCNDAVLEAQKKHPEQFASVGDPTEGALVVAAARSGLWKTDLEAANPRVAELPFDSDRKRMTTIHQLAEDGLFAKTGRPGQLIAFTKGAVDGLLEVSSQVWTEGEIKPLDAEWRKRVLESNNRLAQNGMRVLGIAFRLLDDSRTDDPANPLEKNLIFLGMVGMIDPARPEVSAAVKKALGAGIRPMMITGDHPLTALYIARELGIARNDKVLTGAQLLDMKPEALAEAVMEVSVFARVSPEHKLKIVEALQGKGQIVAMTGDGVNDAPALKRADIGVAMGITGTDVSKEAAEMVLLDDNFATIVAAVEEGRRIFDNIRKFIRYALGSNIGEILVMLGSPFLGMPLALAPLQILWVNLVTDGLPGLALTVEKAERNTMKRPPFNPRDSIFSGGLGLYIIVMGIALGAVTLGIGYWGWSTGQEEWRTMAFTALTLAQMGHVLAVRSEKESAFSLGFFSNRPLIGSVVLTIALQMAVVYVPFLQTIFETSALSLVQLAVSFGAGVVVFALVELSKLITRRQKLK